jgi:hypothetical protein
MDDAQVAEKFKSLAEPVLGADRADQAAGAVMRLEQLTSVTELMGLLRA